MGFKKIPHEDWKVIKKEEVRGGVLFYGRKEDL